MTRILVVALLGAALTAATAPVAAAAPLTAQAAEDAWSAGILALLGAAAIAAVALIVRGDGETRLAGVRLELALLVVAVQDPRWPTSVRAPVVLAFLAIVPGWALLSMWDLARGWAGVGLAIAVSLALATIVPGALMYAGAWSPFTALVILVALTVAASGETIGEAIGERLSHGT